MSGVTFPTTGRFRSLQEFEIIKVIGQGSFGSAVLVRHLTDNQYFVAKQINVSEMNEKERSETVCCCAQFRLRA